jgi:AbrB family looped-hinge helix DNA binding protein
MDNVKPYKAEIKARGQLTIPKKVREEGNLSEGETVSIIPIGDSILITPKGLELDEARREIRKIMKASGMTLETLLEGLENERESLFEKTCGDKKA